MTPDLEALLGRIRHGQRLKPEDADLLEHHLTMDTLVPGLRNRAAYQRHNRDYENAGVHVHLDANDFGQINKLHGEQAGDTALQAIGRAIHGAALPLAGRVFRRGGDEFSAWFLRPEDAQVFAGKVKSALQDLPPAGGTHNHAVSIGIGRGRRQAEEALLRAKAQLGAVDPKTGNREPNYEAGKAPTVIDSGLHEPQPQGWKSAEDRVHEIRLNADGRHYGADGATLPGMDVHAPIKHVVGAQHKHVLPVGVEPSEVKKAEGPPPAFAGQPFVLMSGENPRYHAKYKGHEVLKADMQAQGKPFQEVQGMYDTPEQSLMIFGMTPAEARETAKRYGQESFLYSDGKRNPALVFANGDHADHWHPGKGMQFTEQPPENYYTAIDDPQQPGKKIYMQAAIDWNQLKPLRQLPGHGKGNHPNSYAWHDDAVEPQPVGKLSKAQNEQAAGKGVSTFGETVAPWGQTTPGAATNLRHYDYRPFEAGIDDLARRHGYQFKFMGGRHGIPDLKSDNYNHGSLHIWDPSAGSGGDFGEEAYTRSWRKAHELAHGLTYADLNAKYGEGRRIGKLGVHRTPHEAKRAVEWEWLAAHKQRELGEQLGHHIPDADFNRELNTVMADAVHRAIHGTFTEPSQEGFAPHPHAVPLEEAFKKIDEHAGRMGLGQHDTLKSKAAATPAGPTAPLKAQLGGQQGVTPPAGA